MARLESVWQLAAARERVWEVIARTAEWPAWWPQVLAVDTVGDGDAEGQGGVRRILWRPAGPLIVRVEVEILESCAPLMIVAAARGELVGAGCCSLSVRGATTEVRSCWDVEPRRPLLRGLFHLLAPVVRWTHGRVMHDGAVGLARRLGCRLISARSERGAGG